MDIPKKKRPEDKIRDDLIVLMSKLGWLCEITHGNLYQYGFPDIYAMHSSYGTRWIEVKNPNGYSFTPAQIKKFPLWMSHGVGIYILMAATMDEYQRLFGPPNWYCFLTRHKY